MITLQEFPRTLLLDRCFHPLRGTDSLYKGVYNGILEMGMGKTGQGHGLPGHTRPFIGQAKDIIANNRLTGIGSTQIIAAIRGRSYSDRPGTGTTLLCLKYRTFSGPFKFSFQIVKQMPFSCEKLIPANHNAGGYAKFSGNGSDLLF